MIYFALAKACILMALIVIFFTLFWCEVCRGADKIAKFGAAFLTLIFAFNFVLFAREQLSLISGGNIRIAWYNLFMMGTSCFAMLFPLIYMWAKARKERKEKER